MTVVGLITTLTACKSTGSDERIVAAAIQSGKAAAMVNLPDWPPYCRDLMAKAVPKRGEPVWATQRRWEILREHENKRVQWCADHYAKIQKDYGGDRK